MKKLGIVAVFLAATGAGNFSFYSSYIYFLLAGYYSYE